MAWTAPKTFTAGSTLTGTELNTYLRDNLLETAPAKATTAGGLFISNGVNAIKQVIPGAARNDTAGTTTSTTYTSSLTGGGTGPSVTVTTGTACIVGFRVRMEHTAINAGVYCSWAISGATTRAASDATMVKMDGISANTFVQLADIDQLTDLTAGSNTFTMQYKVDSSPAGTATFQSRHIFAIPL